MLFYIPLSEQLSPEQCAAWQDIQHAALELVRQSDPDDPWLFHGTTNIQAGWILQEGFHPGHLNGAVGRGMPTTNGVYWGDPSVAVGFAERYVASDQLPVLFVARASDVARSTPDNILRPDFFACEEQGCPRYYPDGMGHNSPDLPSYNLGPLGDYSNLPENEEGGITPVNWQQSLMLSGAVTAPDGRHVPNLGLLSIPADLPHDPEAGPCRARRLQDAGGGRLKSYGGKVAPGMEMSLDPRDATGAREVLDGMQLLQHPANTVTCCAPA